MVEWRENASGAKQWEENGREEKTVIGERSEEHVNDCSPTPGFGSWEGTLLRGEDHIFCLVI